MILWLEILFYSDVTVELICDGKADDIPPEMTILKRCSIPILMHLFICFVKKMYYLNKAASCVKPNASQWKAMLLDDFRFSNSTSYM